MNCPNCNSNQIINLGEDKVKCNNCGSLYLSSQIKEKVKKKAKITNLLAMLMLVVIALIAVTAITDPTSVTDVNASSSIVEPDYGDFSDEESSKKTGITYSEKTYLEAWNLAYSYLVGAKKETYVGRYSEAMDSAIDIDVAGMLNIHQSVTYSVKMDSDGNIFQKTDSESSFSKSLHQIYYDASTGLTHYWIAENKDPNKAKIKVYTEEEYMNTLGNLPNGYPINVNESTILSSTFSKCPQGYKYSLILDTQKSVEAYLRKVQDTARTWNGQNIKFTQMNITFTVNPSGYFSSIERTETYTMTGSVAGISGPVVCKYHSIEKFNEKYNDYYISADDMKPSWL